MYSEKKYGRLIKNVYENINLSFSRIRKVAILFGIHTFTNAITILPRRDMSYPHSVLGALVCDPKFQNPCLNVTDSLQKGTHLNIQLFSNRSLRGFQTFHSDFQKFELKRVWLQIILNQKVIIPL